MFVHHPGSATALKGFFLFQRRSCITKLQWYNSHVLLFTMFREA